MSNISDKEADRAWNLAFPLLIVPENTPSNELKFWERRKLKKAIKCCIKLNETSKDSKTLWLLAKIYQRLGDQKQFLDAAITAHHAFPGDLDIITAATTAAIEVGDGDTAVAFSNLGLEITSEQDRVVLAHACISNLIAGFTDRAMHYAQETCKIDSETCYLIKICQDVANGLRPTPMNLNEVFEI